MNFHDMSDGIRLSHHAHGAPVPSVDSLHAAIDTGDNSAGNGGDGYFFGSLVNAPIVIYMPINIPRRTPISRIQSRLIKVPRRLRAWAAMAETTMHRLAEA